MQVCHDGRHRKFPFKPEGEVDHDAHHHQEQCEGSVGEELLPNLRADELDPAQLNAGIGCLERRHDLIALACCGSPRAVFQGQTDHDIARGAEVLHLSVGVAELDHLGSDGFKLGRLGIGDFHHGAAGELD